MELTNNTLVKGLIHCHSENSRYDSGMNVTTLVKKAKELGYGAVSLTDHGTLTGMDDFLAAAKAEGIKPIYGVELYVKDEDDYGRLHLVLLAKDDAGIQGINKIVTETNMHIDQYGIPIATREMLSRYFSQISPYHGHVFATSACVGGVLAGEYLKSLHMEREIAKLSKKMKGGADTQAYEKNLERLEKLQSEIATLTEEKNAMKALAKKPYTKKEKMLKKLERQEGYKEALEALEKEKQESLDALAKIEPLNFQISMKKKDEKSLKEQIKAYEKTFEGNRDVIEKINGIKKNIPTEQESYENAKKAALYFQEIFGKGNFFVELQYHGYVDEESGREIEKESMPVLVRIAKELNIPMTVATDAHMPDGSAESIRVRFLVRAIKFAQRKQLPKENPGDKELYLKSEEELKKALLNVADEKTIDEAIKNTYQICGECHYELTPGEHYPKAVGIGNKTSDEVLRELAKAGISEKFPDGSFSKVYEKRLEYELQVISKMGYSDYFLIVRDFLQFGRKLGKLSDGALEYLRKHIKAMTLDEIESYVASQQTELGFVVGAGRGSAAGSLTAYLVGITDIIDPLKYDLLFERFLNEERVSMPDVDSDFSPAIRDLVVDYCRIRYGADSVANIVTKGYAAPRGAVRNVARIIGIEQGKADYYLMLADKIAKTIPSKPGTSFKDCKELLEDAFSDTNASDEKEKALFKDAREVIRQAKMIENVFLNYGMHAAGVIIADGHPISDYVALMRDDKSGGMKVQCDMVQAEGVHGLLKFDFLGLRNLDVITRAIRIIKMRTGKTIDVTKLPIDDAKVFKNIFSKGLTGSVFQFESEGMRQMLKQFKPTCFEDLIALVSLYRPGPMDFIPDYIKAKYHPESIKYLCPQLKPILSKTYGAIVYQEQVMEIFQKLAGYSLSGADNVRRFMSKKKLEKLVKEREAFLHGDSERGIVGCVKNGIDEKAANTLFDQMLSFASYAFNKSHAAAYAMVSYITAWLKYYYPAEYMCAVLNTTDDIKKMPSVLNDCREMNLKVYAPDVNHSQLAFSVSEDGGVIFGLDSVKGTRAESAEAIVQERNENGSFLDYKEFFLRTNPDKSTAENLIKAGALDGFSDNRSSLLFAYEQIQVLAKKISDREKQIADREKTPEDKREKRLISYLRNAYENLKSLNEQLNMIGLENYKEDTKEKLLKEKEVLGFFVSAHPLDGYRIPSDVKQIAHVSEQDVHVCIMGIIQDLRITQRKADGKPMAFFTLEDTSGKIPVCCFTKAYAENNAMLKENEIVKLYGKVLLEQNDTLNADGSDEEETIIKVSCDHIEEAGQDFGDIVVFIRDIFDYNNTISKIEANGLLTKKGRRLTFFDLQRGEYRSTKFFVKDDILFDNGYKAKKIG